MVFGDVEGFEESCGVVCHVLDGVVAQELAGLACVAVVEEDELMVGARRVGSWVPQSRRLKLRPMIIKRG
jgi:hypothetical protein